MNESYSGPYFLYVDILIHSNEIHI